MQAAAPFGTSWMAYDAQVFAAWSQRRLSDRTRLNLGRTDHEQGFVVTPTQTLAIATRRAGWQHCDDGTNRRATVLNLAAIRPRAGGHTHPLGGDRPIIAVLPGDEDGLMAVGTGKPAYVISAARAFAIEAGEVFIVRLIGGRKFGSAEREVVARRTRTWAQDGGGSSATCRFVPE